MTRHEPILRGGCADGPPGGQVISLFAFVQDSNALRQPPPEGTSAQELMQHRVGPVTAVIGLVPTADYCGPDVDRHLADINWLAPRLRYHAEAVAWTMQRSPVFPVPFGTFYTSLESLTAFMRAHEAAITGFFSAITGKEEWELRAGAEFDSPDILDELACKAWPELRSSPKGVRYMRLCRDRNALLEFGRAEAAALVRDIVAELEPLTAAIREHHLAGPRPGSRPAEPTARYALLVEKANVAAVCERAREMAVCAARQHVAIALSGPLPPFSFRPNLNTPAEVAQG